MCRDQKLHFSLLIIQRKGNSLFIYLWLSKCKLAKTYFQKIKICIFWGNLKGRRLTTELPLWGGKFWCYPSPFVRNVKILRKVAGTDPGCCKVAPGTVWGTARLNRHSNPKDEAEQWLLASFELRHQNGMGLIGFLTSSFEVTIGHLSIVFKQIKISCIL